MRFLWRPIAIKFVLVRSKCSATKVHRHAICLLSKPRCDAQVRQPAVSAMRRKSSRHSCLRCEKFNLKSWDDSLPLGAKSLRNQENVNCWTSSSRILFQGSDHEVAFDFLQSQLCGMFTSSIRLTSLNITAWLVNGFLARALGQWPPRLRC
jgi:hypothetical protein